MHEVPGLGLLCLVAAGLVLGCGVSELKALGTARCAPPPHAEVTASDYHAPQDLVSLGYSDGGFELRRGATQVLACGAHDAKISNIAFSPDGTMLCTADIAGRVALSLIEKRETVPLLELPSEIFGLAFSPTGSVIAVSAGPEVVLVDRFGTKIAQAGLAGSVGALTFSRDGKQLIAAGGRLTFLSVPHLRIQRTVVLRKESYREQAVFATDVRLSPNAQKIGVLLTRGVAFFDLETGQLDVATPDGWLPVGLRFAPDGRMAVFARNRFYIGPADPGRLAQDHSIPAGELTDIEFRRDGSLLVVGGPLVSTE